MLLGVALRGQEDEATHSSIATCEIVYGKSKAFGSLTLPFCSVDY